MYYYSVAANVADTNEPPPEATDMTCHFVMGRSATMFVPPVCQSTARRTNGDMMTREASTNPADVTCKRCMSNIKFKKAAKAAAAKEGK